MIDAEQPSRPVALVTGGGVRLGRALALGLAEDGHDLVVSWRSSEEPAREVAQLVEGLGRRCALVRADLAEPEGAEAVVRAAREAYGRLDVLVNSAAGFDETPLLEVDAGVWDGIMAVNVRAAHLTVRAAADLLEATGGCVVNITDLSAWQAWSQHPVHAVSKAALAHLTRVQARALAPRVRVNGVAPGAVLPPDDYDEGRYEAVVRRTPLARIGSPEDVVRAVRYLVDSPFVTGEILVVDGGRLLGPSGPPR